MTARRVEISPAHRVIREYRRAMEELRAQGVEHELGLRPALQNLLHDSARLHGWSFIAEQEAKAGGDRVVPDGVVQDANSLPRGYWEAKDTHDDLAREIDKKIRRGYPISNTIFEDTKRAVLYQDRARALEADLADARQVADLLHLFYSHTEPEIREFEGAEEEFQERVWALVWGAGLTRRCQPCIFRIFCLQTVGRRLASRNMRYKNLPRWDE